MKRKLALVIILSCLGLASCGEKVESEADTYAKLAEAKGYPVDATLGKTDLPTVDDVTEENTENTENTSEAADEVESKAEINENDSQTSEGEVIEEEAVATPTPAPTTTTGYVLEEDTKEYLKGLGATDSDLANVKSDDDLATLITKLFGGGGSNTGNSGSTAGGGSSSSDTGSSGATGEDVRDPSMIPQLDTTNAPAGRM